MQKKMAPKVGFEPTTNRLTADCSTTELLRNNEKFIMLLHTKYIISIFIIFTSGLLYFFAAKCYFALIF